MSIPQSSGTDSPGQEYLYDVFLSHQSGDKLQVEAIAARLEDEEGLKPFLDKWHLIPGEPWEEALEDALDQSKTCAVFLGPGGLGPWENEEMRVALDARVRNQSFRVIPILLPGAEPKDRKTLPRFLSRLTWVDFRAGLDDPDAFRRLVAGIRGLPPGRKIAVTQQKATPISNLPFSRNDFFTGREDILKDLHSGFISGQAEQALSGLGGVGKTQTAIEYAYRYEEHYRILLWAKAHTRESLVTDYVAITALLNLPEKDAQDQGEAVVAVKRWLESRGDWLLILDNADELAVARQFIPMRKTGHVLLTTRAQNTKPLAVQRAVEKMSPSEGARFFLSRLGEITRDAPTESAAAELRSQAEALSKDLDGLPLALDQAAAFIEETPSTLEEYRALYQSARKELLKRRGALASDHPSVTVTFSLAFKKVEESDLAAADLLRVCAFLEADSIPEEIFTEGAEELGDALGAAIKSSLGLRDAIAEAGRYSLLQRNPDSQTVNLHRLVQLVLRDEMDEATRRSWAERAVRAVNSVFPSGEYSTWPSCDRLISHASALAEVIDEYGFDFPESARLMNLAGAYFRARAQYGEAKPLLKRSLAIRERTEGAEHPDVAQSLNNLALLYHNQGKYAEAELLYRRALAIRENAFGDEHPDVAGTLNNLAWLYKNQVKYVEAEPLYKRALIIRENAFGDEHPDVATSLNDLAALYYNQGKYAEAEPLYKRALVIRENAFGDEHPDVATSLNDLALLYHNQGKYAEAEPLYKRALAISEKTLGDEHPDVVHSLNGLALLYKSQGKYMEAELLYKRSLAMGEKSLGAGHPGVAGTLNNLAALYKNQGKSVEAELLYKRALAISEKAFGDEHPDVATSLNDLAALYYSQGKYAEAEPLYKQAMAIREKALGDEHPDVAQSLNNLALLYCNQGKYAEAEPLYKRSLAIREKALGAGHPDVALVLLRYSSLFIKRWRIIKATQLAIRAVSILRKYPGRLINAFHSLPSRWPGKEFLVKRLQQK